MKDEERDEELEKVRNTGRKRKRGRQKWRRRRD
jgi:hypothetical protein